MPPLRFVAFVCAALACREPTEIVIELTTDVPCSTVALHHVSIRLGPANGLATLANATSVIEADSCNGDGGIGSLVAIPSGSHDDLVGIAAVLGVTESTSSCDADPSGCIVARRSLRYSAGTPLHLPIALRSECLGVSCVASQTCAQGLCVPDDVPPCVEGQCTNPVADGGGAVCAPPSLAANMPAPVLAWHFDEGQGATTQDAGNVLPPVALVAATWTTGPAGCGAALHVDGKGNLALGDHPAFTAPGGMTVSFRARTTFGGQDIARATATAGFDVLGGCVDLFDPSAPDVECPLPGFTDGAWHQVSISITGHGSQAASYRLRVDDMDTGELPAVAVYTPAQNLPLSVPKGFVGDIDEVLVYDQPL